MFKILKRGISSKSIDRIQEVKYLGLIKDVLEGEKIESRNGLTRNLFGRSMSFNLEDNTIPILTSKKMAWKTCLKELLWFINGSTNNDILKNQNVNIWNGNANREFLNNRGLFHYAENDLGPILSGWVGVTTTQETHRSKLV